MDPISGNNQLDTIRLPQLGDKVRLRAVMTAELFSGAQSELEKPFDNPLEKSLEKPFEKPFDNPLEKSLEKPFEKPFGKPVEMRREKPLEKRVGKPREKRSTVGFSLVPDEADQPSHAEEQESGSLWDFHPSDTYDEDLYAAETAVSTRHRHAAETAVSARHGHAAQGTPTDSHGTSTAYAATDLYAAETAVSTRHGHTAETAVSTRYRHTVLDTPADSHGTSSAYAATDFYVAASTATAGGWFGSAGSIDADYADDAFEDADLEDDALMDEAYDDVQAEMDDDVRMAWDGASETRSARVDANERRGIWAVIDAVCFVPEKIGSFVLEAMGHIHARGLVAMGIALLVTFALYNPVRDLYLASRRLDTLQKTYDAIAVQNEQLEHDIEVLQTREGIENEARARGYVEPGETKVVVRGLNMEGSDTSTYTIEDIELPDERPWYIKMLDSLFGYDPEA